MKTINLKILFAITGTAAALLTLSPSNVLAKPVQGQEKTGKNCERKDTSTSSTFGKCESVCKDKDLTRDAPNNRWVCKASSVKVTNPGRILLPTNTLPIDTLPITKLNEPFN